MKGTTLEFLPVLNTNSFTTVYTQELQETPCELYADIQARTFTITTPQYCELVEDLCSNTYVGRIENENISLFFEQGSKAFGKLQEIRETEATIYFERLIINGADAVIIKEYCEKSRSNILSIYLEEGNLKNKIFVFNAANEKGIIKMFKTHRFRKNLLK